MYILIGEKDNMDKNWLKRHWMNVLVGGIFIFVLIPLGVAFLLNFRFIITDTTNEWIGFWGGYLGSIIGGMITLYVMYVTICNENKAKKREEKIQFFNQIIKNYCCVASVTFELINKILDGVFETRIEGYNDILNLFNKCARESNELEILLRTRQYQYDLDKLIDKIKKISSYCEDAMKLYKRFIEEKENREKIEQDIQDLANEATEYEANIQKLITKTVIKNLEK